jgi:hypothetical protein
MDILTNWANQNQGVLAIVLFLLTLIISWASGLFKWIFSKFKKNIPTISTDGDIIADRDILVGNKTFIQKSGKDSINIQGENITLNNHANDK